MNETSTCGPRQQDRRVYQLTQHGVFVGEYKTPEELGKVIDLAELVEDVPAGPDPEQLF